MSNRTASSFGATDQRVYVTNNRVPVFDYNSEQIKLDLSNNVVPILTDISNTLDNFDSTFDLSINGSTLWADSTPVGNPFYADLNGREGWYYSNLSNILNKSNVYWYANPVSGSLQENDMTFAQLSTMYAIITCDFVDNGELTVPFMGVYSQPTGVSDYIPGFAHSRWIYQLNATNRAKLRKGETIIVHTGATRPQVHLNLPAYQLTLFSQNGTALPNEIIAYLSVNTNVTTSPVGYLLQYAGYLNSAIGFNREYKFLNGKDRIIQNNLSSGFFGITGSVSISPGTLVGITGLCGVTGSVSISNFPTLQGVTGQVSLASNTLVGITGLCGVTGSVSISNFPTLQGVTGQVSLAPGTLVGVTGLCGVTGSVSISNFPTLQGVTGQVSLAPNTLVGITGLCGVTGSVSISNFPTLQGVTGQVSLAPGTLVGITGLCGVTGSVEISNFPTLQGVTGQVSLVSNTLVGITGLCGVTGSVSISNFPTLQGVTGQVSLASNTLVGITGLCGVTGSVSISNFPTLQGVTGQVSLAPNSYVGITGLVGVTGDFNLTVGAVDISGVNVTNGKLNTFDSSANANLTTIETDISSGILVKGQDDTGVRNPFYVDTNGIQRTEIVTGHIETAKYVFSTDASVITSNSGVNWALDPRGRRPGWYYTGATSVALNWYANSISVPPTIQFNKMQAVWMVVTPDYVADLPKFRVTTTVSVWEYTYSTAIVPAVYNGETFLFYYGQKAINLHPSVSPRLMTRTLISGAGANNENITGISIFTNSNVGTLYQSAGIYDQTNAQQFETIFSDNNDYTEQQNLLKLSFDASLNLKTTVNNLQANPVFTRLTGTNLVGITGLAGVTGSVGINAGSFVGITGIAGITGQVSLASGSAVGITQGSNTATVSGYFGVLNGQQALPSLYTSSALYAHEPTGGTTDTLTYTGVTIGATAHRSIDTYITGVNGNVGVTGAISILPNQTVNSVLRAKDVFNTAFNDLTATSTTSSSAFYNGLDVFVKNGSTTPYSVAGLNVYPIYPKKIHYTLLGRSESTVNAVIMGGSGSSKFYYDFSFGLSNPQTFSVLQSAGSVPKTIKYHYVDANGDLQTDGSATITALNTVVTLTPNMISINKHFIHGQVGSAEQFLIRVGTANNAVNTIASSDVDDYYNGVITVPNGYIGYLTNFSVYTPSQAFVFILKWDAAGYRSVVYNHYNSSNAPIQSGSNGSIGGIFTAGESIAFGKSAIGSSLMSGNFVLEPI